MRHHPGEDLLLAYASGASGEALSLIVATHLAFCAECRQSIAALETAGGAMLSDMQPVAMQAGALSRMLSRLDDQIPKMVAPKVTGDVPAPLRAYAGNRTRDVRWRMIAPGISYRPLFTHGATRAQLIRVEPSHGVADHTHAGQEFSLVLAGGYTDITGQYGVGDFQTTSEDVDHAPVADADGVCVILAVTEAPLVFRSWLPKLIGRLAGF